MTRLWLELAWLGGDTVEPGVLLVIDDGVIAEVGRADGPPAGSEPVHGLTLPGFANTHSHAFQRGLRARTQRQKGSFWTWREAMFAAADTLSPETYFQLAKAAFGEMVLAGITLVGEFHYVHHSPDGTPYADPNAMGEAVTEAAAAAGIRLTLLDTCYLHGGFNERPQGAQRRFADSGIDAWIERVEALRPGATVKVGGAAHSVRALRPAELKEIAAWARARQLPLHAHVSEQRRENDECLGTYGRTPVELLAESGCLDTSFTAVHATHVTDGDRRLLAASRVTCCLCPTTERDLADGIAPASELASDGLMLTLGTDSNALIDMFEEARAMELNERLSTERRVNQEPAALLHAATAAGYSALGWSGGSFEAGACADLCVIALDSVRLAGACREDLVSAVVFAAAPPDVRHVMANGRWIVRDGAHVSMDVVAELEDALR